MTARREYNQSARHEGRIELECERVREDSETESEFDSKKGI